MAYRFSHPTVFTHARDSQASARLLIRRIGAVLLLLGGLTMVATLLAPSAGRPPILAFAPIGLACFGFAAFLILAPRVPDWALLATPPLGTLLITASLTGVAAAAPGSRAAGRALQKCRQSPPHSRTQRRKRPATARSSRT